jgi:hypothetical protein
VQDEIFFLLDEQGEFISVQALERRQTIMIFGIDRTSGIKKAHTNDSSLDVLKQHFSVLQIRGVETFSEPIVDRGEQILSFLTFDIVGMEDFRVLPQTYIGQPVRQIGHRLHPPDSDGFAAYRLAALE